MMSDSAAARPAGPVAVHRRRSMRGHAKRLHARPPFDLICDTLVSGCAIRHEEWIANHLARPSLRLASTRRASDGERLTGRAVSETRRAEEGGPARSGERGARWSAWRLRLPPRRRTQG